MAKRVLEKGKSDVRVDILYRVLLGFVIVGVLINLVIIFFFKAMQAEAGRSSTTSPFINKQSHMPPEPRLQVTPAQDLREIEEKENQILNSYGWIDKSKGVVRIPIQEAMRIVVQKQLMNPVNSGNPSQTQPEQKK